MYWRIQENYSFLEIQTRKLAENEVISVELALQAYLTEMYLKLSFIEKITRGYNTKTAV